MCVFVCVSVYMCVIGAAFDLRTIPRTEFRNLPTMNAALTINSTMHIALFGPVIFL